MSSLLTALPTQPVEGPCDPRLLVRLQEVATAFREGNSAHLGSSLTSKARVEVDLREIAGPQGAYAAGQLEVIFRHIFRELEIRDLVFAPIRTSAPRAAFARGRLYAKPRNGTETEEWTLTLSLRPEGGDWRIFEIRSSR